MKRNEQRTKTKKAERAERNTEYKATPSTPDNRPKAKSKTGPSPNRNQSLPPFPTGEKASGSQDNPESTHEPKGKAGRPTNTQAKTKVQKIYSKKNQKHKQKQKQKQTPNTTLK